MPDHKRPERIALLTAALLRRGQLTATEGVGLFADDANPPDRKQVKKDLALIEGALNLPPCTVRGRERVWVAPTDGVEPLRGQLDHIALHIGRAHVRFLEGTDLALPTPRLTARPEPTTGNVRDLRGRDRDDLHGGFYVVPEPERRYDGHTDIIAALVDGVVRAWAVDLTYRKGDGSSRTHEAAQVYRLVLYRRALYALVRPTPGAELRLYAVDRITAARVHRRPHGLPTDDVDVRGHFRDVFGVVKDGRGPSEVRLRFAAERAHLVRERVWHPSQRLEDLPDGRVDLVMNATGSELVRFALEWGEMCEVVRPAWLREAVVGALRGALALYERPSSDGEVS